MKQLITFGIPCYNEEDNVVRAHKELSTFAKKYPHYAFEFIYVDNGSKDATRKKIEDVVAKDARATGIFLSRNFGPESSGQAALDYAHGDAFMFYECDMQDPIHVAAQFIEKWEEGYDVVIGVRTKTEDPWIMMILRKLFYRLFKAVSNIEVPVNAGSFALLDRVVIDALNSLPEKNRFHRGLRAWVGFRTATVPYERRRRQFGASSYTIFRYLRHAERSFFGFSYLPLDIIISLGFILVLVAFLFLILYFFSVFLFHWVSPHAMTLLTGIIVFFGGVQLLAVSFVGKYIQVIMEETKHRPMYIVEHTVGTLPSARKRSASKPALSTR